jgi:hypothetical protein
MIEAMKQALEALEQVTKELLAVRDELAERGARPTTNVFHQRLWDSSFSAYTDHAIPAAQSLRQAIREHAMYEVQRLGQEIEQEQPLPPVEIGVDVTTDGASVVAFYRRPNAVMEMFYSQFHPAPQRTEQNFCPRCGKRTNDIHTCTPPQEKNT